MSMTHRGMLVALINGVTCTFDGDDWASEDRNLANSLNIATDSSPKSHYTIVDRAEHVIRKLGLSDQAQIIRWQAEAHVDDIPPDAID